MKNSLDDESKKVFEKSIKLLDNSQTQLKEIRQALRKAVVRLSLAARANDRQLNTVLDEIEASVNDEINVSVLDAQLDDLFVLLNRENTDGKNVPFDEEDDELEAEVRQFVEKLRSALEFQSNGKSMSTAEILAELSNEILQYVNALKLTSDRNATTGDANLGDSKINSVLANMVSHLTLPDDVRSTQSDLVKSLDKPIENIEDWKNVIGNVVSLVNTSIETLEAEKSELENFIQKITVQLADIESYVRSTREDQRDASEQAAMLKESVDASVDDIQHEVELTEDIDELKKGVNVHLKNIRKNVEEHAKSEKQKDEASRKGFTRVIDELVDSQREVKKLQEQLEENQSRLLRDPLTGLPNRLAYNERIAVEVNRWKRSDTPLTLAVWDLDKFKSINDTYGHDAGDRVLKLFAQIISTRIRKVDLFARIGGEEFVLLMPDTTRMAALDLNNRLRTSLEHCGFHYKGKPCLITASVGIAAFEDNETAEQVLKNADVALYQSKHNGRNCCTVYRADMSE